jgi:hypothetical protein
MERPLLYLFIVCSIYISFIQDVKGQIPNPSFEQWDAALPDGWIASLYAGKVLAGVEKSTNSFEGNNAVHLYSKYFGQSFWPGNLSTTFQLNERPIGLRMRYICSHPSVYVDIGLSKNGVSTAHTVGFLDKVSSTYLDTIITIPDTSAEIPDVMGITFDVYGDVIIDALELVYRSSASAGSQVSSSLLNPYPIPTIGSELVVPVVLCSGDKVNMDLINSQGIILMTRTYQAVGDGCNNFYVDIEKISTGSYFIRVYNSLFTSTRKIIIEH